MRAACWAETKPRLEWPALRRLAIAFIVPQFAFLCESRAVRRPPGSPFAQALKPTFQNRPGRRLSVQEVEAMTCPDPEETGEAVLGLPVRPDVLRHLEECPYCRQEALVLIRFLDGPDPDRGPH
jgi:hypothetical protein